MNVLWLIAIMIGALALGFFFLQILAWIITNKTQTMQAEDLVSDNINKRLERNVQMIEIIYQIRACPDTQAVDNLWKEYYRLDALDKELTKTEHLQELEAERGYFG